jgi:DNA invertase Pin-like site-specific DNA recombinase
VSKIGYARISKVIQHADGQVKRLADYGCTKVFVDEGASGAKASRPQWDACLAYLREGDELVTVRLDRVGRSVRNLVDLIASLGERKVDLTVLDQNISTTTAGSRLVFHVFAAIAEFERDLIIERTRDGLAATKARGRSGGRKPELPEGLQAQVRTWRAEGWSVNVIRDELAARYGKQVGRTTIYRTLGMTSDAPDE